MTSSDIVEVRSGLRSMGSISGRQKPGRQLTALLTASAMIFGLLLPVLAVALLIIFILHRARARSGSALATGLIVMGVFGWMNAQKGIIEDWAWYTNHYRMLQQLPLQDYLGHYVPPFQIKWSEPIYYCGAFLLTRASNGSIAVLAAAITAAIYLPLTFAVTKILARSSLTAVERSFVMLLALLGGITFTLTTQLVRQEIASALLILGVIQYVYGRHRLGVLFVVAALLTHNSVLVPLAAFLMAAEYVAPAGKILRRRLMLAGSLFAFLGLFAGNYLGSRGYDALSKDDGSVSILVYLADALLFTVFLRLKSSMAWIGPLHSLIVSAFCLHIAFALGVIGQPVPFLRMYFYVEVFRAIMITCIGVTLIKRNSLAVIAIPAFAVILLYAEVRILRSPYDYHGGIMQHLLSPLLFRS